MTWNSVPHYWQLWEESPGHRWVRPQTANNADLWMFSVLLDWISCWTNKGVPSNLSRSCDCNDLSEHAYINTLDHYLRTENEACWRGSYLIRSHRDLSSHYNDVIMGAIASQITSLTIVFSTIYLDTDQRKHQSSASLASVRGIHRVPVNFPHKWPLSRKMFPFDDFIMLYDILKWSSSSKRELY